MSAGVFFSRVERGERSGAFNAGAAPGEMNELRAVSAALNRVQGAIEFDLHGIVRTPTTT
jgi:hypothetical protein